MKSKDYEKLVIEDCVTLMISGKDRHIKMMVDFEKDGLSKTIEMCRISFVDDIIKYHESDNIKNEIYASNIDIYKLLRGIVIMYMIAETYYIDEEIKSRKKV